MSELPTPYGPGSGAPRRVRIPHLRQLKERGERWAMLTAYDQYTAQIFDEAGIPVLLVGDSAANNVLRLRRRHCRSRVDEMLPLVRAVARSARRGARRRRPAVRLLPGLARAGPARPPSGS